MVIYLKSIIIVRCKRVILGIKKAYRYYIWYVSGYIRYIVLYEENFYNVVRCFC